MHARVGTLKVDLIDSILSMYHTKAFRYLAFSVNGVKIVHKMALLVFFVVQLVYLVDFLCVFVLAHSIKYSIL